MNKFFHLGAAQVDDAPRDVSEEMSSDPLHPEEEAFDPTEALAKLGVSEPREIDIDEERARAGISPDPETGQGDARGDGDIPAMDLSAFRTVDHEPTPLDSVREARADIERTLDSDPYADQRAAQQDKPTAMRFNAGKLRYDLLPPDAIQELVKVYTMGAEKYAARNWEKGLSLTQCYASLERHSAAWMAGEDRDPESGLLHMAHVAWNAIAITAFQMRGVGEDDRPQIPSDKS